MKARILMVIAVAAVLTLLLATFSWAGGRVAQRQLRQQRRIVHGVRNGTITDREFLRLEREQHHIQATKRRAWADGYLSRPERCYLEWAQNRASRHIYRMKNNGRAYYGYRAPYRTRYHPQHYRRYRPTYCSVCRVHYHYRGYCYPWYGYGFFFSGVMAQPDRLVAWSAGGY
ncbi:MAG: hypothetical protein JRJ12_04485 [Deltaproteobacteria bacterium]|nr:hypothetical protein [Deltaproteobacteria bacterium]